MMIDDDNEVEKDEEDGLVLDHLNHFMAPTEGLTLFRPQEKPDSTRFTQRRQIT